MITLTWALRIPKGQQFSVECTFPNSRSLQWNRQNSSTPHKVDSESEEIRQTFLTENVTVKDRGLYKCQMRIDNVNVSLRANYPLEVSDDNSYVKGKLPFC